MTPGGGAGSPTHNSFQLGVDVDDECRSHGREQTGLVSKLARVHLEQRTGLTNIRVVFRSSSYLFMNSLS